MTTARRGHCVGEQLLPLWTLLLEGYVPVGHIVADLDELEAPAPAESAGPRDPYLTGGRLRLAKAA